MLRADRTRPRGGASQFETKDDASPVTALDSTDRASHARHARRHLPEPRGAGGGGRSLRILSMPSISLGARPDRRHPAAFIAGMPVYGTLIALTCGGTRSSASSTIRSPGNAGSGSPAGPRRSMEGRSARGAAAARRRPDVVRAIRTRLGETSAPASSACARRRHGGSRAGAARLREPCVRPHRLQRGQRRPPRARTSRACARDRRRRRCDYRLERAADDASFGTRYRCRGPARHVEGLALLRDG